MRSKEIEQHDPVKDTNQPMICQATTKQDSKMKRNRDKTETYVEQSRSLHTQSCKTDCREKECHAPPNYPSLATYSEEVSKQK
jgi:hypothetical protein